jgi:hypothetical protein
MKKKKLWWGWHKNENKNFMVGVAQKWKKKSHGGGGTKTNLMVGVAER